MTSASAQPDADRRREVRDSVLATAPGGVLLFVMLLSLALHGGGAYYLYDKHFGYVDPSSLTAERAPIRVKRAAYDRITDVRIGASAEAQAAQQMTLADLSATLLTTQAPPSLDEGDFEPELHLRDLEDALPAQPAAELAVELPPFELPEEVLQELASGANPQELAFQSTAEAGFGTAGGSGGDGAGGGSAAARELLRGTGLVTGVRGPSPTESAVVDEPPALDTALLDVPVSAPEIDFARLALEGTTKLDVPEHLDEDFDYSVTTYRDPKARNEAGYFRVDIVPRRSLVRLKAMPKDVIFLIDTSSSLPQEWVAAVSTGVSQALVSLNEGDRFNVVLFKENPAFFSTRGPQPATVENVAAAQQFLTAARSEGYTDVNAALAQLLVRDVAVDRVYTLVLISDGVPTKGVLDTRELINLITRDNNLSASIYGVAVGGRQNRELMDFLSYRNKGYTLAASRPEQVGPVVRDLASRLRYPLIKGLRVSVAGQGVEQVYPVDLPNIHQSERFAIFGRFARPTEFTMQISGNSAGRNVDFTFSRHLGQATPGDEAVARDWAFWKLHHLYSELIRRGQDKTILDEIERLRKRYKLKTLY